MRRIAAILAVLLMAKPTFGQTTHTATLTWTDSTTPGITGYNVYRLVNPTSTQCQPTGTITGFSLLNSSPLSATATTYSDATVVAANSYCYGVVAVTPGGQSLPSNLVILPQGPSGLALTGVQ